MYRTPGGNHLDPAQGKLAVLLPGMGAVATTFIAGVEAVRRGASVPVGSLTQLGMLPGEEGTSQEPVAIGEAVSLASLDDLVFGGWDIYEENCFEAACQADVLSREHLEAARDCLAAIKPMAAVFDQNYVRNLSGSNVKRGETKMDLAEALMADVANFMADNGCSRAVAIWCGSTESFVELEAVHQSIESFEKGLRTSHPKISPSMIYAYALLRSGVPFANGAPNRSVDCPAIVALAEREGVAIAGKDFKTGQTLMKTILAPGFAARLLGVHGWYSTNILGNRDGAVLDDPGSFRTKEESKLSVLDSILDKTKNPELYASMTHKVRIDYYPPRGDNKEGWDNIDIFGWMGYPMQIKINFLCRDSILAAPLVLDLALFMDLAQRSGRCGVQDWLSFYFKSPQQNGAESIEHNLFIQQRMLEQTLREIAGMSVARPLAHVRSLNA
ncbi:MAG: inositol-3-phosphate synthase [Bradymonadaceae bacterium]|nr:inositol-3-phosphate synthase [Lujinxingiaceae bacterium]